MTERIDHAAEAVNFLGAVTYDTHGDDDRKVQLAQVHATLALVEQQRIANIIEISKPRRLPDGSEASYMLYNPETYELPQYIREGLGI